VIGPPSVRSIRFLKCQTASLFTGRYLLPAKDKRENRLMKDPQNRKQRESKHLFIRSLLLLHPPLSLIFIKMYASGLVRERREMLKACHKSKMTAQERPSSVKQVQRPLASSPAIPRGGVYLDHHLNSPKSKLPLMFLLDNK
jgi:hypothetical protein